jgi:hypothetical protein
VRALVLTLFAVAALAPRSAAAYDIELDSETIGQGYQLIGADGHVIDRRRLTQSLGLNVWNIGPKDAFGAPTAKNQFYFTMQLRIDSDLSSGGSAFYPQSGLLGGRNVSDELANNQLDILYAYIGARDLLGFIDVKLGRQIDVDTFQFTSYDGLSVEVKTPYYLALQVYGGLLVDGAMPFDSPVYRPDGTAWKPAAGSDPESHDHDWKPTLGLVLKSFGFRDIDARFSYRHTWSPGQNETADEKALHATDGTSEEKLAWSVRGRLLHGMVIPWVGVRYDVLVGVVDNAQAGVRFTLAPRHSLSLEYLYSYPTFDGDSIWNVFARNQFDDLRAGYDLNLGRARVYARAFLRFFHDTTTLFDASAAPKPSAMLDYGGNLGGRLDLPRGYVRADAYGELGYGGQRLGIDVASRMRIYKELASVEGRLTFVHFSDDLRPTDNGDSFGIQLGARLQLGRGILLHLILEDNINQYYNSQLRLYAVLDLAILFGTHGFAQGLPRGIGPGMGQFTMGGGY